MQRIIWTLICNCELHSTNVGSNWSFWFFNVRALDFKFILLLVLFLKTLVRPVTYPFLSILLVTLRIYLTLCGHCSTLYVREGHISNFLCTKICQPRYFRRCSDCPTQLLRSWDLSRGSYSDPSLLPNEQEPGLSRPSSMSVPLSAFKASSTRTPLLRAAVSPLTQQCQLPAVNCVQTSHRVFLRECRISFSLLKNILLMTKDTHLVKSYYQI